MAGSRTTAGGAPDRTPSCVSPSGIAAEREAPDGSETGSTGSTAVCAGQDDSETEGTGVLSTGAARTFAAAARAPDAATVSVSGASTAALSVSAPTSATVTVVADTAGIGATAAASFVMALRRGFVLRMRTSTAAPVAADDVEGVSKPK